MNANLLNLSAMLVLLFGGKNIYAQQYQAEMIPFGDMDQWVDRQIEESGIIGGATKHVYAIAPTAVITDNSAYRNMGGSPWATSNVMARVAGITKTNTSVFPEKREDGYCARMDTRMESVKVFGLIENRIRATGFSRITDVPGRDFPAAILLLQKRWEDEDGNIYAKRVGTMVVRYYTTTGTWKNNVTYPILYGDITGNPTYKAHMMRLQVEERYAVNSKGESVPIQEVAWGTADDVPTHLVLQFTSSHGGAYVGSPGNSLWVDNVKLIY